MFWPVPVADSLSALPSIEVCAAAGQLTMKAALNAGTRKFLFECQPYDSER
jgi:hypothetical protein